MKKPTFPLFLCSVGVIISLVTGCGPRPTQLMDTVTTTPSFTPTMTKTTAPTSTPTPTQTATPTITKTPLPMNTLTVQERENLVREFLSGNPDCKLPCWLGITPGKTTWNEAQQILRYFGVRISTHPREDNALSIYETGSFDFEDKKIYHDFSFAERAGNVDFIVITSHGYHNPGEFQALWMNYSPEILMKTFGKPDQVWLDVTGPNPSIYRGYLLWLFYEQLGFMIRYDGSVLDAPILHICPKIDPKGDIKANGNIQIIDLSIRSPDNPLPLGYFDQVFTNTNPSSTYLFYVLHSIQDAAGMDEKKFYNIFIEEKPACFDTKRDIWDVK